MAYRCDPPEMPKLEDLLRKRREKKIDIEITPRTRQGERKFQIIFHRYPIISREIKRSKIILCDSDSSGMCDVGCSIGI